MANRSPRHNADTSVSYGAVVRQLAEGGVVNAENLPQDLIEAIRDLGWKGDIRKFVIYWGPLPRGIPIVDKSLRHDH